MAEAFNTALESLADAVAPGHHPLVGLAKDVAACAVLLTSVGALAVGGCVFAQDMAASGVSGRMADGG